MLVISGTSWLAHLSENVAAGGLLLDAPALATLNGFCTR